MPSEALVPTSPAAVYSGPMAHEPPRVKDDRVYTYGDYLDWPDEEQWEILEGVAYDMSPAPSRRHQAMLTELLRQIANYLEDKPCEVYPAAFDVRLPDRAEQEDRDITTVVQPDIVVVCRPDRLDDRGARGAPDLAIEIISPSSASKDVIKKRRIYERHGVREYWIVDLSNRILYVYVLGPEGRYGPPETHGAEETVGVRVVEGLTVDLSRAFGKV